MSTRTSRESAAKSEDEQPGREVPGWQVPPDYANGIISPCPESASRTSCGDRNLSSVKGEEAAWLVTLSRTCGQIPQIAAGMSLLRAILRA